jgi:hypothetical protein
MSTFVVKVSSSGVSHVRASSKGKNLGTLLAEEAAK